MQDPALATRYKEAGFNTYVALSNGPTERQLAELKQAGLGVICDQNKVGLSHMDDPTIVGWMHGDEPDLAKPGGQPPVPPEKIIADYKRIRMADPARPVLLNLGPGVADEGCVGRGARRGHMEDYSEYIKGSDIVSFDIYPVASAPPEVTGKLWYVARGVERLVKWSDGHKVVWNCLECTGINNTNRKPTPQEVRCEAWMSIIHGARGLIWFVHEFKPVFREAALFDDPEMLAAVTAINRQITSLAPVINSPALSNAASVTSDNAPVALAARRHDGDLYMFAACMRGEKTKATIQVAGRSSGVEVIGENRTIPSNGGLFVDQFNPWDVHIYRISAEEKSAKQ